MSEPTFDDAVLRRWIADWRTGEAVDASAADDPLLERLRQLLLAMANRMPIQTLDLIALVRQWMLRTAAGGGPKWVRVPTEAPWPNATAWEAADFEVARLGSTFDVCATLPRLPWLGEQSDLFDDAFASKPARHPTWIPADPVFETLLGEGSFTGPGQREAVRALLQAPSDVTLIANLPTGSGKSLLAQIPPLWRREGYLTLVIVPTVALAIDQERRMNQLFRRQDSNWQDRTLAYHGGLSTAQRAEVFEGLREGKQRVLFTSPEAATGNLRRALLESAAAGRLTHVMVDEAHIVASWGSGFRPAFQLLPSLVRRLREACPKHASIRVVLASATITAHTLDVLQRQFGPPQRTEVVSAVYLRPEPRYGSRRCEDAGEQRARVLQALSAAPRPYILYVTRPEEAAAWLGTLRTAGFGRVAQFTGDTSSADRHRLLQQWARNELDGMVATSAFGLGVDKGDVRLVLHATFPESLDRFYQEVGRGGRDGLASASLLLFTPDDIAQASGMGARNFIGNDLGYDRWLAMVDRSFRIDPASDELWVDLNTVRSELQTQGPSNLRWNLRTLNLMAMAGLVELCGLSATDPRQAGEAEVEGVFDYELRFAALSRLRPDHKDRASFDRHMNGARESYERSGRDAFDALSAIANGQVPVEDGLASLYQLGGRLRWSPVDRLCGGCVSHWTSRPRSALTPRPLVGRLRRFRAGDAQAWPSALPRVESALSLIRVEDIKVSVSHGPLLPAILGRLRPHTVLLPHDAPSSLVESVRKVVSRLGSDVFIDLFEPNDPTTTDAGAGEIRLVLWTASTISTEMLTSLRTSPGTLCAMLVERRLPDPTRPDRLLTDVLDCADEAEALRALTT